MARPGTDADGEASAAAAYYRMEQNGEVYAVAGTYTSGMNADGKITFGENGYAAFGFTIPAWRLRKQASGGAGLNGAEFTLTCTVDIVDENTGETSQAACCPYGGEDGNFGWEPLGEGESAGAFTLGSLRIETPPAGVYALGGEQGPEWLRPASVCHCF